jgi:hypothetical protein
MSETIRREIEERGLRCRSALESCGNLYLQLSLIGDVPGVSMRVVLKALEQLQTGLLEKLNRFDRKGKWS